jgi:hypothetical protein
MNTKKALRQAIADSDLTVREKMALRLALVFHADKVDEIVNEAMKAEGVSAVGANVDWAKVIKFFIENVLPLLLKLLG